MGERGKALAPPDPQIAAHAHALDEVLLSDDQAFAHCEGLSWEDWTR